MNLTLVVRQWLNRKARQATFWKATHYSAIPHYVKPHYIDIHDSYKPRTYDEVYEQLSSKEFEIQIQRVLYKPTDIRQELKGRKAILIANMQQFLLTQLQELRFKVLVGCRYDEKTKNLKLTCEQFPSYEQNYTKINEMFYEIMMETKRAP